MKYKVVNLTKKGEVWTCQLEYWKGCYCSKESVDVVIEQEARPNLNEVKTAAGIQGLVS